VPKIQVDDELAAIQRIKSMFKEIPLRSRARVLDYIMQWSEEWKNGDEEPTRDPMVISDDQATIFPG
jgi:hypothetical protein